MGAKVEDRSREPVPGDSGRRAWRSGKQDEIFLVEGVQEVRGLVGLEVERRRASERRVLSARDEARQQEARVRARELHFVLVLCREELDRFPFPIDENRAPRPRDLAYEAPENAAER